jgi:hypothetical protein
MPGVCNELVLLWELFQQYVNCGINGILGLTILSARGENNIWYQSGNAHERNTDLVWTQDLVYSVHR